MGLKDQDLILDEATEKLLADILTAATAISKKLGDWPRHGLEVSDILACVAKLTVSVNERNKLQEMIAKVDEMTSHKRDVGNPYEFTDREDGECWGWNSLREDVRDVLGPEIERKGMR